MRVIYTFLKCELGTVYDVAAYLVDQIEETSEVFSVSGEHDLMVRFNLPVDMDVGRFVCDHVQTVPNVRDTKTLVTFNAFTKDSGTGL